MNLNRKIKGIESGGMPGYNRKIDEILEAVNWLLGIRTINGTKISEDTTGPVIDLAPPNDQSAINKSGGVGDMKKSDYDTTPPDPSVVTHEVDRSRWADAGPWSKAPDGSVAGWVQHDVCISGTTVAKWFWGQTT